MNASLRTLLALALLVGCGDDDDPMTDAGTDTSDMPDAPMDDAMVDPDTETPDTGPELGCAPPATTPCDGDSGGPGILNEHAAGYFADRQEMIIHGGNTAIPVMCGFPAWVYQETTYIYYDYTGECGGRWVEITGGPSPRGRHAGVVAGDSFFVYGGRFRAAGASSGPYTVLNDLWRFDADTRTWTEIEPVGDAAPSGRFNHTLVYEEENNRLWLYAGNASTSGASPIVLDDIWSFDIDAGAWTEHTPPTVPPGRMWHAATFDQTRGQMVIWAGGDDGSFIAGDYHDDVWGYDVEAGDWTELHDGRGTAPDARFWGTLVHDTANDVYLSFAGHDNGGLGNRNDTWTFDPETNQWSMLGVGDTFNSPSTGFCMFPADFAAVDLAVPERRNAASLVWSESCGHSVLFGGKTDCGAINDVWFYDDAGWNVVFSSGLGEVCARANGSVDGCSQMCF